MVSKTFLGLDIGGTKCVVCLGDLSGKPIDRIKFPTAESFKAVWEELKKSINDLLKRNEFSTADIKAAGVSCGGPLDSKSGVVLSPPNLPGWDNIPIVKLLEEEFKIPAFLMNDANACALAEWRFGAGKGAQNMIFLTMGTGLGAGLIMNGRLYEGACGMGGEIGHIRLRKDGPVGYGKNGSFEGFCGGNGIAEYAKTTAENYSNYKFVEEYINIIGSKNYSVKNLDIAQAQGNRFAAEIFEKVGTMLGKGLAVLIDCLNPEKIVIGSIFERSEDILRPHMERVLKRECLPESLNSCKVHAAVLGDRIGEYASLLVARHGADAL
jgi:glucokinase